MRLLLIAAGVLAIAMGLLWVGQGFGLIRWPASSFMIDQSVWSLWGALLGVGGVALILLGQRLPRR